MITKGADSTCEGLAWKGYAECCHGNATGGADRIRLAKEKHGAEMHRHDGQRLGMDENGMAKERHRSDEMRSERQRKRMEETGEAEASP